MVPRFLTPYHRQGFYPGDAFRTLAEGDPGLAEDLIRLLEEDPYFFRSGYWKEDAIRLLNRFDHPEYIRQRLRVVCLRKVEKGFCREFRRYCRLARANKNEWIEQELVSRQESPSLEVRVMATWMLNAIRQR